MKYKRIRELREDNDKKQTELAKFLKITQPKYQLYESGKRSLPIDYLTKLAIFYSTSIDYILRHYKSNFALSSCEIKHKKIRVSYPLIS